MAGIRSPGLRVTWLSSLFLVLVLASGFSSCFSFFFLPYQKKTISIFQFNSESEGFRFLSVRLFSVTLAKKSRFWDLHNFLHRGNTEIATDNSLEITVKGKKTGPGD